MSDPKKKEPAELNDDQLEEVSGGKEEVVSVQPMGYKYCVVNRKHRYIAILNACPECGSTEFTYR